MPPKILIVEDEFLLALDLERVLADAGFNVIGMAADAKEALALGAQACLALVDLNLRDGLTGPHVAQELAHRHGIPIIYVTANPAQIGQPAPTAVGVVAKPFSDRAILAAVQYATTGTHPGSSATHFTPLR